MLLPQRVERLHGGGGRLRGGEHSVQHRIRGACASGRGPADHAPPGPRRHWRRRWQPCKVRHRCERSSPVQRRREGEEPSLRPSSHHGRVESCVCGSSLRGQLRGRRSLLREEAQRRAAVAGSRMHRRSLSAVHVSRGARLCFHRVRPAALRVGAGPSFRVQRVRRQLRRELALQRAVEAVLDRVVAAAGELRGRRQRGAEASGWRHALCGRWCSSECRAYGGRRGSSRLPRL